MIRHKDDQPRKKEPAPRRRTKPPAPPEETAPGASAKPQEPEKPSRAAGRPMWSGTLTFGLVSVPVTLVAAVHEERAALRMLDADGTPLARRYYCPADETEVHPEHILRGFEVEPERYVVVRDEEIEALEPERSRDIDLRRFVKESQIDPMLFERAYYLMPGGESTKAYRLLVEAMAASGRAGIATFVMREREYLVAIFAQNGLLRAQTLRFADELRTPGDVGLDERVDPPAEMVQQMVREIDRLTEEQIEPATMTETRLARLRELVEAKAARGEDVIEGTSVAADAPVEDLIAALRRSVEAKNPPPQKR
jgi:DNA end-binding protein Ku